jgi:hypothetical protein
MSDEKGQLGTDPMRAWTDLQRSWTEALQSMATKASDMSTTAIHPEGLRSFVNAWMETQRKFVEQGMMLRDLFPSPELAERFTSATSMYLQFYKWWADSLSAAKEGGLQGVVPEAAVNMWRQTYHSFVEPMMAMPWLSGAKELRGAMGYPLDAADALVDMQRNWSDMLDRAAKTAIEGLESSGPEVMREFYASWAKGYEMTVGKLVRIPPIGPARQGIELYQKSLDSYLRLCGAAFDFYLRMSRPSLDALANISKEAQKLMGEDVTPETFEKLYGLTIKEFEKRLQELFSADEFVRALRTTLEASLTFQKDYQAFIEANLKGTPIVTRTEMDEVHEEMYLLRKQVRTLADKIKGLADAE